MIVVTGAAGFIGSDYVKKAPADGYTLLTVGDDIALWRALGIHQGINVLTDFAPVALLGTVDFFLVVSGEAMKASTPQELVEWIRKQDGVSYAAATGSSQHIAAELMVKRAQLKATLVPYRGTGPALQDVLLQQEVWLAPLAVVIQERGFNQDRLGVYLVLGLYLAGNLALFIATLAAILLAVVVPKLITMLSEAVNSAKQAMNMLLSSWANRGVNLWKVDLVSVPLVEGQATYAVEDRTIMILDAYVSTPELGTFKAGQIVNRFGVFRHFIKGFNQIWLC